MKMKQTDETNRERKQLAKRFLPVGLIIVLSILLMGILFITRKMDLLQANEMIELNTASEQELQKLDGIDADKAKQIIAKRPYWKVEDVTGVAGLEAAKVRYWKTEKLVYVKKMDKTVEQYFPDPVFAQLVAKALNRWPSQGVLPEELATITILEADLTSKVKIKELTGIGLLTGLQSLSMMDQAIADLPAEIKHNTELVTLSLASNQLETLPAELGSAGKLESLYLNDNQLKTLPAELGQLTQLNLLVLDANQLKELPNAIGQLGALKKVYAANNQLTSLPESIGNWQQLEQLNITHNQLTSLPAEVAGWQNLTHLWLRENKLTGLPSSLGKLPKLTYLEVSSNQLQSLPKVLGQATSLELLLLDHNQLSELPKELGNLTSLKRFSVAHNQLEAIPNEILALATAADQDVSGTWLELQQQTKELAKRKGSLKELDERTLLPEIMTAVNQELPHYAAQAGYQDSHFKFTNIKDKTTRSCTFAELFASKTSVAELLASPGTYKVEIEVAENYKLKEDLNVYALYGGHRFTYQLQVLA